jgi:hypothetical protein
VIPNEEEFTDAVRRCIIFLVAYCDWVPMLLLGIIGMRNVGAAVGLSVLGVAAAVVIWCVKPRRGVETGPSSFRNERERATYLMSRPPYCSPRQMPHLPAKFGVQPGRTIG